MKIHTHRAYKSQERHFFRKKSACGSASHTHRAFFPKKKRLRQCITHTQGIFSEKKAHIYIHIHIYMYIYIYIYIHMWSASDVKACLPVCTANTGVALGSSWEPLGFSAWPLATHSFSYHFISQKLCPTAPKPTQRCPKTVVLEPQVEMRKQWFRWCETFIKHLGK